MNEVMAILQRLVAFPTLSRQTNLPLVDYVESYLADYGVTARRVYSEDGLRANLYATLGVADRGGLCFSGHSDVVPTAGQPWRSDPFELTRRGDRLYGRGTADMKGFLACMLASLPVFQRAVSRSGAPPIHLAFSYDEEIGCVGVRGLLDELAADAARPIGCVVGEPTLMRPITAHKGKSAWRCTVRGQAAHSSYPQRGVNAIDIAAELVLWLRQQGRDWQRQSLDDRYQPAWSTVQVGLIQGGSAVNIVPDRCVFDFEIRSLPGTSHGQLAQALASFAQRHLLPGMRLTSPDTDIQFERLVEYPGLNDDTALDALKARCNAALGRKDFGAVSFGTEAGLFQQAGIPTLVCGPGDIAQAHQADEYIELAQLRHCLEFMERLVNL
ncbi:acetylornithine deacetylase [Martelella alba]|uniref:Acetylornithine deacetylase n=1 Tax=Martelella alba TaxID=2590451 RepID=A0ABY2SKE6_9HYPH|nr:acetylornithine deacetylase [Martelella alba]TKI06051.1 acetylornithine deacetylase [Martelella alba]